MTLLPRVVFLLLKFQSTPPERLLRHIYELSAWLVT